MKFCVSVLLCFFMVGPRLKAQHQASRNGGQRYTAEVHVPSPPRFVIRAADTETQHKIEACLSEAWGRIYRFWFSDLSEPLRIPSTPIELHYTPRASQDPSGATSFNIYQGTVRVSRIEIETDRSMLCNTVSHELAHVLMAIFSRRAVPRYFDEASAMFFEAPSVVDSMLFRAARVNTPVFSIQELIRMRQYPRDVLAFYAQSLLLGIYLSQEIGTPHQYVNFVSEAESDISGACHRIYGKTFAEIERGYEAWRIRMRDPVFRDSYLRRLPSTPPSLRPLTSF